MTIDLTGKVALITGAGTGIGRATALVLAGYGARVAVTGRRLEMVEETARLVEKAGGEALAIRADVSVEDDVRSAVDQTVARFGSLDVACNNAGTVGPLKPIVELTSEDYETTMGTNLRGALLCLKYELAVMAEQRSGAIVNISSVNAALPEASGALYCSSKVALDMLTRVAALEHAAQGIRINSIRPGFVLTPMHDAVLDEMGGATPENIEAVESAVPMRRRAEPEEIAEAVAWLCSADSRYITGETLTVDGGTSLA